MNSSKKPVPFQGVFSIPLDVGRSPRWDQLDGWWMGRWMNEWIGKRCTLTILMLGMVTHGLFYIFLFSFWLVFTSVPGWRIHNCSKKPTKKKWCAAYLGCELDTFKPFQIVLVVPLIRISSPKHIKERPCAAYLGCEPETPKGVYHHNCNFFVGNMMMNQWSLRRLIFTQINRFGVMKTHLLQNLDPQ